MTEEECSRGKALLEEVALRYAAGHGLRPQLSWDDQGYQWLLKAVDAEHTVRMVFSPDEIEVYAAEGAVDKDAKVKIRNAFASLSM